MTTQKHLNRERETCLLPAEKCSPHIFLICLKFLTCHECAFFLVDSRTCDMITRHRDSRATWYESLRATFLDVYVEEIGPTDKSCMAFSGMAKWNRDLE
jgi:hypothetical protein